MQFDVISLILFRIVDISINDLKSLATYKIYVLKYIHNAKYTAYKIINRIIILKLT